MFGVWNYVLTVQVDSYVFGVWNNVLSYLYRWIVSYKCSESGTMSILPVQVDSEL